VRQCAATAGLPNPPSLPLSSVLPRGYRSRRVMMRVSNRLHSPYSTANIEIFCLEVERAAQIQQPLQANAGYDASRSKPSYDFKQFEKSQTRWRQGCICWNPIGGGDPHCEGAPFLKDKSGDGQHAFDHSALGCRAPIDPATGGSSSAHPATDPRPVVFQGWVLARCL
jgi:hypothetical protein